MLHSLILLSLATAITAFSASANNNVAVYWGQNSYGSQTRLKDYCQDDYVDILLLSFLYSFPDNLQVDFANQCWDSFDDGLRKCDTIAEDIQYCQSQGKIVLLSMGGATGAYGFTDDAQATSFADTLWNKFGAGTDTERPFGDAIVDGFDFDFELNNPTGTVALGKALLEKYKTDTSKKYYLSAAPQCPYPDASVGELLEGVELDFAFIQFYNNYCNLGTSNFNWDTWQDYADNTSPNKNIKLFVGQPGGQTGAGSGYNEMSVVKEAIASIKSSANFGGLSFWDASQAYSNVENGESYVQQAKEALGTAATTNAATTQAATTQTATTQTATTQTATTQAATTQAAAATTSSTSTKAAAATTSSTSTKAAAATTSTKAATTSTKAATTSTKATTSSTSTNAATTSTKATTSSTSTNAATTSTKATTSSTSTKAATTSTKATTSSTSTETATTSTKATVATSTDAAEATSTKAATKLSTTLAKTTGPTSIPYIIPTTKTTTADVVSTLTPETVTSVTLKGQQVVTLTLTKHNSIYVTSTKTIPPHVKTITKVHTPTTVVTRYTGTVTIVATQYLDPPNFKF